MAMLERGDRLVVSELSRLGRSLGQIVGLLDQLVKQGIAVIAIKENLRIEGQQDMQTKVMTTLFALFAEIERDLSRNVPRKVWPVPGSPEKSWDDRKDPRRVASGLMRRARPRWAGRS